MASAFESSFKDLSLSAEPVNPGLFHLSLNLLFQPETETLIEKKKYLELALKEEHSTTHLVLKNLIAMINHRLPRRQCEVRKILENTNARHPEHLNTLANLENVYRELHRQTDADMCKSAKDKILKSQDPKDKELQAQCVLEQGYALIFDDASHYEGAANPKLRDSLKILTAEHNKSSGHRKEHLARALRHTQQACLSLISSMQWKREDEHMQRKTSSIEKMLYGLKLLEEIGKKYTVEYKIWQFFLAMAYNRFDYSVSQQEGDTDTNVTRIDLCCQVLQYFWDTILEFKDQTETLLFTARSYAYIGHLLISRKTLLNDLISSTTFSCFKDSNFLCLVKDPMSCFNEAMRLHPKDTVVLNRCGKSLRNTALFLTENPNRKLSTLLEAHSLLTKSIELLPHNNWFAYASRMETSRDLSRFDHAHAEGWLIEARLDGINCFNTKATEKDLCILASLCQMLGKFPNIKRYGPTFVTDKEYIHEAINYLNYALQLGGFVSYSVAYNLATCLYEIEEYRTAIEWMKRAMYLSKTGNANSLTRISEYILAFYNAKVAEGDENPEYLFEELINVVSLGKSKYSDITKSINNLCKYQQEGMLTFIQYLFNASKLNDDFSRDLVISCLDACKRTFSNTDNNEIIDVLEDQLRILPPPTANVDKDLPSNRIHIPPDVVMPFSVDVSIQHTKYQYDFFVSHSNVNRDWVNGYLLHQLETKLHDDDVAFKGCIADRDFKPGETIINNIVDAVNRSYKIILVITSDFINSRWCDYEMDQSLTDILSGKKDNNCVIPILLENIDLVDYPKKLNHITFLDLTDETKHDQDIMKLKRALLPDESL